VVLIKERTPKITYNITPVPIINKLNAIIKSRDEEDSFLDIKK
jgi:hypothetical protein